MARCRQSLHRSVGATGLYGLDGHVDGQFGGGGGLQSDRRSDPRVARSASGLMKRSAVWLAVIAAAAVVGPLLAPYAPDALDLANRRAAPSLVHWFGTDDLGRDMFSRAL